MKLSLISSPVILQQNWVNEAEKFFDARVLRAKPWTLADWNQDKDIRTVWIVKISWLQKDTAFKNMVNGPDFAEKVKVLSTFSDEAHLFGRSPTSQQNSILRNLVKKSNFNVLITGTIFPLGPSNDAKEVLESLGGPFDNRGRWSVTIRKVLDRLLQATVNQKVSTFSVLVLRIIAAPFILRRTTRSVWEGEWVIKRTIARPIPQIVKPYVDDFSEKAAKAQFRKKKGTETQHSLMDRADKQRFFAWTSLFGQYLEKTKGVRDETDKVKIMENIVKRGLDSPDFIMSGRLRRFVALVKSFHKAGERFIVVSDRIFPLVLTYWVDLQFSQIALIFFFRSVARN